MENCLGFCHVRNFTYLCVAKKIIKLWMTWQKYKINSEKLTFLGGFFRLRSNLMLF